MQANIVLVTGISRDLLYVVGFASIGHVHSLNESLRLWLITRKKTKRKSYTVASKFILEPSPDNAT